MNTLPFWEKKKKTLCVWHVFLLGALFSQASTEECHFIIGVNSDNLLAAAKNKIHQKTLLMRRLSTHQSVCLHALWWLLLACKSHVNEKPKLPQRILVNIADYFIHLYFLTRFPIWFLKESK